MSYLLDTHTLLWWLDNNSTLSASAREVIANPNNLILVSAVSAWEISIKKAIGKLEAPSDLSSAMKRNRFEPLPISIPISRETRMAEAREFGICDDRAIAHNLDMTLVERL